MASDNPAVQARLEEGATLYESGKLYEALIAWKEVLAQDPDNEIAQEYLRFVEDEFQIGVDALLAHHQGAPQPPSPPPPPPPSVPPVETSVPPPAAEALLDDELIDELFSSIAPVSARASRPPGFDEDVPVSDAVSAQPGTPPTSQAPGSQVPGSQVPGSQVPDSQVPGSVAPAAQSSTPPVSPVPAAQPSTPPVSAAPIAQPSTPPVFPAPVAQPSTPPVFPAPVAQPSTPPVSQASIVPSAETDAPAVNSRSPARPSGPIRQRVSKVPVRRDSAPQPVVGRDSAPQPVTSRGPDSIEEMDWSNILEEGVDNGVTPPEAAVPKADEEFFVEMGAGRLEVEPGDEAAAWGASRSSISAPAVPQLAAPTRDPFEMAASHFVDAAPSSFTDEPSVPDTWGDDALELNDMSDASIDVMLEADFQSWENDPFADGDATAEPDEWSNAAESFDAQDLPFAPPADPSAQLAEPMSPAPDPTEPAVDASVSQAEPADVPTQTKPASPEAPAEPASAAELPDPPAPFESQDSFPDGASLLDDLLGPEDSVEIPIPTLDEVRQARQTQQLASMPSKIGGFDAPPLDSQALESLPPLPNDDPDAPFEADADDAPPALDWLDTGFDPPSMELADPDEIGDVFGSLEEPLAADPPPPPPGNANNAESSAGSSNAGNSNGRITQPGLGDPGSVLVQTPNEMAVAPTLDLPDTSALRARPLPTDPPLPGDPIKAPEAAPEPAAAAIFGRKRRGNPVEPGAVADARRRVAGPVVEAPKATIDPAIEALLRAGLEDLEAIESDSSAGSESLEIRQRMPAPPPGDLDLDGLMNQARQKQAAGDFSGSLALVEQVLAAQPNHPRAQAYLQANTDRLLEMYRSKLGPLTRMPRVKLRPEEIIWQALDHRAGFLLSQVDGRTSYEDLIEIAGMSEVEATRTLARLVDYELIG